MTAKNGNQTMVKSVEKVFSILEYLRDSQRATVTQISRDLGMPTSTAHLHLATLTELGYVVKIQEEYTTSLKFIGLANSARKNYQIISKSLKEMQELADKTGEVVWLIVEEHGKAVNLEKAIGGQGIRTLDKQGLRTHLHYHAGGKAILAHLPEWRVEEIIENQGLPRRTKNTITEKRHLIEELNEIKARGYSFDDEEAVKGLREVAAPIIVDDEILGSVAVMGPSHRLQGAKFREEIPNELLGTVNAIELICKYGREG